MNSAVLKTTILSIIFMGMIILAAGLALLLFKQLIAPYMRYLLPIPPIGVASYVFVYNMFSKYDGQVPGSVWKIIPEICWASGISSIFFLLFTVFLVLMVNALK